jgi:hypothetical protein
LFPLSTSTSSSQFEQTSSKRRKQTDQSQQSQQQRGTRQSRVRFTQHAPQPQLNRNPTPLQTDDTRRRLLALLDSRPVRGLEELMARGAIRSAFARLLSEELANEQLFFAETMRGWFNWQLYDTIEPSMPVTLVVKVCVLCCVVGCVVGCVSVLA